MWMACYESAGVRAQIRQPVFDSLKNALLPKLVSSIVNTKIDDFRFESFGAKCQSRDFYIRNFELRDNLDLTLRDGQVCLNSNNIYLGLSLHLDCSAFFIHSDGNAKIHLGVNQFNLCLKIKVSDDKKFDFDVTQKNVQINDVRIEVINGDFFFEKILPILLNLLHGSIRDIINDLVRDKLNDFVVNTLRELIKQTPTEIEFDRDNHMIVDYSPAGVPVLQSGISYLSSSYFYKSGDGSRRIPPFEEPQDVPEFADNYGIIFTFSEFMINDILWSYFINTDHFHFEIDSQSRFIPVNFTVKDFSEAIFIGLDKIFEPSTPIRIKLEGLSRPEVFIRNNGIEGKMPLSVEFLVVVNGQDIRFVRFELDVAIGLSATLLDSKTLKIKLNKATINSFTFVKYFDFDFQETTAIIILTGLLEFFVNFFNFSYEIPISAFPEEIVLIDSVLVYNDALLSLMANVEFKPFRQSGYIIREI